MSRAISQAVVPDPTLVTVALEWSECTGMDAPTHAWPQATGVKSMRQAAEATRVDEMRVARAHQIAENALRSDAFAAPTLMYCIQPQHYGNGRKEVIGEEAEQEPARSQRHCQFIDVLLCGLELRDRDHALDCCDRDSRPLLTRCFQSCIRLCCLCTTQFSVYS